MRSIDEHLQQVCRLLSPVESSLLPLERIHCDMIAAQPAYAQVPIPPWSNSAMDGFLVHASDLCGHAPWTLKVVGDLPAGAPPQAPPRGAALRIMTGAAVDKHETDLVVVPFENTNITPGPGPVPRQVSIMEHDPRRTHIRVQGENLAPGDQVLPAGTRLDAGALASLISAGVTHIEAYRRPRLSILATGDELASSAAHLRTGQIPDSNRPMLAALARKYGAEVRSALVKDDPAAVTAALNEAAEHSDLILSSGGVSVGAFDVIREVSSSSGDMWFGTVAQKPGAPQGCGLWKGTPLVCLPGNPVAAFVSFHLYVAVALRVLAGEAVPASVMNRPRVRARLASEVKHLGTIHILPVRLDFSGDEPVAFLRAQAPHFVGSLPEVDGLALVEPDNAAELGELVNVLLLV